MSRQDVSVEFQRQSMYANGSMKLYGVTIVADEKDGSGTLRATGKEADVGPDGSTIDLRGDVRLESSEVTAHTDRATFAKTENIVRTPGAVELTEGKTTAKGVGMTFDRDRDVLTILDQAAISMGSDAGVTTAISAGTAIFARRERYRQFDRSVRLQRAGQLIEAETAIAHLSEDSTWIETIELRGATKITAANPAPGALQQLNGNDVMLTYAPDGEALQHVVIGSAAAIQIAGEAGKPGREIVAGTMDIGLAPDGSTPTALTGRDAVRLTIPPEGATLGRTIQAASLNAQGEPGRGLSRALFTGNVQFRERGPNVNRAASAATLDVGLKRGMSAIEDAKFSHSVRFEEGKLLATSAAARYDVDKGTLQLSGSEPGALVPHVGNDQIGVHAAKLDVTLEGPKMKAAAAGTEKVKSILQPPSKSDAGEGQGGERKTKMPSMLKQDQPVNVTAGTLDYDGT